MTVAAPRAAARSPRCPIYHRHEGRLYRVRFWSEAEWLEMPASDRPEFYEFDDNLRCWVGLASVDHICN